LNKRKRNKKEIKRDSVSPSLIRVVSALSRRGSIVKTLYDAIKIIMLVTLKRNNKN